MICARMYAGGCGSEAEVKKHGVESSETQTSPAAATGTH